jgi:hypothetical protein
MRWVTKPIVGLKHITFHFIDAHMWFQKHCVTTRGFSLISQMDCMKVVEDMKL